MERQIFRFAKIILRDRCSTSYDLAAGFRIQNANRYTTGPADGSDGAHELSLGSSGRDQVLQHTVRKSEAVRGP